MKYRVTLLANLSEGEKFQFANENGTLKSDREYFVEGQYPKFNCTTVFAKDRIETSRTGDKCTEMVTAVENDQWVRWIPNEIAYTCHKVKIYLR